MEDLIKREDAIKAIVERFMMNRSYAERMLEDIPTIDIVHCGECEYFKPHESVFGKGWICTRNHIVVGSVDYCSYGERIEE